MRLGRVACTGCWIGRLAELIRAQGTRWTGDLVDTPARELTALDCVVVSSDAFVLDGCRQCLNLAEAVLAELAPERALGDLGPPVTPRPASEQL
jgi:hypothetical protein